MKRVILAVAACAALVAAQAEEQGGGLVQISGKGKIAVVDCTAGVDWKVAQEAFTKFDQSFHLKVERQTGAPFEVETAAEAVRKTGASAVLFVGDRPGYPLSLDAPEQKWAFVNLAPLKGDTAKFGHRFSVMVMRGLCRALGAGVSGGSQTALSPAYSLADLDAIKDLGIGFDSFLGISGSYEKLGLEPIDYITFRDACELENPPTPTNDLQRAIAAEVKAAMKK